MNKSTRQIELKIPIPHGENELKDAIRKKIGNGYHYAVRKKSLDARDKKDIRYLYTVEYSKNPITDQEEPIERLAENKQPSLPVVVVGSGPAGLFCALRLLERGIKPIVVERGAPVDEREQKIQLFMGQRILDTNTNIQFGEGGAGTFSDGKLNTGTHSGQLKKVLKTFCEFGAPKEILWLNKPHIGSDNLKKVVKNMREYIQKQGGQVCFHTRLDGINTQGKALEISLFDLKTQQQKTLAVSALVLAIGHSARDTFQMLQKQGVAMTAKDFAVGVRIEHLQKQISFSQYGEKYPLLPPADYKLVSHASDRAAFTFCMCPGGYVMPAASEIGGVVANGMSNYSRNGENANSALIVQVRKTDFASEDALAGVQFQREIERAAYIAGGKDYKAPIQLVKDFLSDKESSGFGSVQPTYGAGTAFADLRAVLPSFLIDPLKKAITDMDRKLHGFACPDAILTGAETRTSSPVRIERDGKSLQSVSHAKLYPCGEGAGYAGGISSSAADGIRVADAIFYQMNN